MSKIVTNKETPIGEMIYLTQPLSDAPISIYVLHGKQGDMLIDTGFIPSYSKVLSWIMENDFYIKDILITHAHQDHDWNVAKMSKKLGARIWLGADDVSLIGNFSSQKQLPIAPQYKKRANICNFWGKFSLLQSPKYEPDVIVTEDGTAQAKEYGYDFILITLPGHTRGSIGVLDGDVLYCGDAFAMLPNGPTLPPHVASLELAKGTWEKMLALSPKYIAPGHGTPVELSEVRTVLKAGLLRTS